MKKIILILSIVLIGESIFAQQQSLYSQYMFNQFLINPAITGNVDYIPVRLTARQQWVGVNDAPSSQSLSGHMLLGNKNMGIGGYFFSDSFGPETKVGVQASYSYILKIDRRRDTKLAFGIAARAFQYRLDYNKLVAIDHSDELLYSNTETTFVPDADFGVYLYNDKYSVGMSATQLIGLPVEITKNQTKQNDMLRHYYLQGAYKFRITREFQLEPSVMFRATEVAPVSVDFNVRGIYNQYYWLGLSYRSSNTMAAMIGIKYNHIVLGYAYDFSFSKMINYQSGTHEIILGYNFNEKNKKGSSLL